MDEERKKTEEKPIRDERGWFLPGNPGSPGRPKGKTIKERVREWLETHPEDMQDFVKHFVKKNRELAWTMMEGSPGKSVDVTSGGKPLPILGHESLPQDDGDGKDPEAL